VDEENNRKAGVIFSGNQKMNISSPPMLDLLSREEEEASHHASYAPSSLPVLSVCPLFKSGDNKIDNEDRDLGTKFHEVLEARLGGDNSPHELGVDGEERIQWAIDRIKMELTDEFPVELEHRLYLMSDDFSEVTFGTADVINGPRIWDLKTGLRRDDFYWMQLTCYALMLMRRDGYDKVECSMVYTRYRQIHTFVVTKEEAEGAIFGLLEHLNDDTEKRAVPNDHCNWCGNLTTCDEVKKRIDAVAGGREDWELEDYHSSRISDPVEMAKAWKLAKLMQKWCESVLFHAKEMMVTDGIPIPGLEIKERSGRRYIEDISTAFDQLQDLDQKEFMSACSIAVGKLEDAVATKRGISKYKAKKALNEELGENLKTGKSSIFLQEQKEKTNKRKK